MERSQRWNEDGSVVELNDRGDQKIQDRRALRNLWEVFRRARDDRVRHRRRRAHGRVRDELERSRTR